jgi:hypothetical protein
MEFCACFSTASDSFSNAGPGPRAPSIPFEGMHGCKKFSNPRRMGTMLALKRLDHNGHVLWCRRRVCVWVPGGGHTANPDVDCVHARESKNNANQGAAAASSATFTTAVKTSLTVISSHSN